MYTKLNDIIKKLIEDYKNHINEYGLSDEIYKWQLLYKYNGLPSLKIETFAAEIKKINFSNLIYSAGIGVIRKLAFEKTNEYFDGFKNLFDENIDLTQRINLFNKKTHKLYREIEPNEKLSHHHDERTIATLLTYHNPEKYTFYKDAVYQDYCKFLGITPKNVGEKYVHYLELIEDLRVNYILKDDDLLQIVDNLLSKSDCYSDNSRMILSQDILYQMLTEYSGATLKYWVFQGNPSFYRISDALNNNALKTWSVSQHKTQIKEGDKIILWQTGDKAGIYALATVTSSVYYGEDKEDELDFYIDKSSAKPSDCVDLRIDLNLSQDPLYKNNVLSIPELKDLKQGKQGTNFPATELQYNTILKLIQMSYYDELIKFLKQAKTNDLKTAHYLSSYLDVKVKVSFGQGGPANIPWISFLRDEQTTQNGIYPVYLYFKDIDLLILSYGISETNIPEVNWPLANPLTIDKYFTENNFGVPFRYGKSYVFKAYNINKLPQRDALDKDLFEIVNYYKSIKLKEMSIKALIGSINFSYNPFLESINDSNLFFNNSLIIRFTSTLLTKPFAILTGLSGSGKTKLAQAFAMWLCENENQYSIVPVGADWTNREPLLGFPNGLDKNSYVTPDSGALQLMIRAMEKGNETKPYFLILDEMNLSHVERYFADFLSVMESKEKLMLYSGADRKSSDGTKIPKEISWPKNLFIVGTVNIDETTYMFSPKVLDRANVIEFRVTAKEMEAYLDSSNSLDMNAMKGKGANMANDFLNIANEDIASDNVKEISDALLIFFTELKKNGAEFGYRSASEILRFAGIAKKIEPSWTQDEIIDAAIMQKLLPKLHGSRNKLTKVLPVLGSFCLKDKKKEKYFDDIDSINFIEDPNIIYRISFEKICRMYKNAIENGYANYTEA